MKQRIIVRCLLYVSFKEATFMDYSITEVKPYYHCNREPTR